MNQKSDTGWPSLTDGTLQKYYKIWLEADGGWASKLAAALAAFMADHPLPQSTQGKCLETLGEALRSDPDYAWGWHCNIAMACHDAGARPHSACNEGAARFLRALFPGVDTTTHPAYSQTQEIPLPPPPLTDDLILKAMVGWDIGKKRGEGPSGCMRRALEAAGGCTVPETVSDAFWRLLEPGVDVWREGDEYWRQSHGCWTSALAGDILNKSVVDSVVPGRRRVTPAPVPEWISVKERMPTAADGDAGGFVLARYADGRVLNLHWEQLEPDEHWMRCAPVAALPQRPVPEDPQRVLFEQWAVGRGLNIERVPGTGEYYSAETCHNWQVWQAATEGVQP